METEAGEHVIFEGHPSWRSIIGFYVLAAMGILLAGALAAGITRLIDDEVNWGVVGVLVLACAGLVVLVGLVKRMATTYAITNRRLYIRRGVVSRNVEQTRLDRVQGVTTRQSVLERILQVGTVDFDTAATGEADFAFRGVAQPEKVMQSVDEAQREHDAESTSAEPPRPE